MLIAFLKVLLMIIEVLASIMLIGVILLQRTKSQGAGGLAFGVGMGEQIFGTQAGNVLTKTTIVLGIVFLANTAALSVIYASGQGQRSVVDSVPVSAVPRPTAQPQGIPPAQPEQAQPTAPVAPVAAPAGTSAPQPAPAAGQ
jgi:preprotein translocase subunit SecG